MKHSNNHTSWESLFVLMLYGLFAFLAFTMVAVGAGVYSDIRDTGNDNYDIRTSLSFAATQIRQSDSAENITIRPYQGGNALVMEEEIDGADYETWLYHYDGAMYQLFMQKGIMFTPQSGEKIMDIEKFDISAYNDNLLLFQAQNTKGKKGEIIVSLRSQKGGNEHGQN